MMQLTKTCQDEVLHEVVALVLAAVENAGGEAEALAARAVVAWRGGAIPAGLASQDPDDLRLRGALWASQLEEILSPPGGQALESAP